MCDDDLYVAIPLADDAADEAAVSGSDEVVYPSDEHHPEGGRGRGEAEFDCARDVQLRCCVYGRVTACAVQERDAGGVRRQ